MRAGRVSDTQHEAIRAAQLEQPDWRLTDTPTQPVLRNLRSAG
jgi:hypothetical protein